MVETALIIFAHCRGKNTSDTTVYFKIKKEIIGLIFNQKKAHNAKLLWAKSHNEKRGIKIYRLSYVLGQSLQTA